MDESKISNKQVDFEIRFYERLVKGKPNFVDALIPLAAAYTRKGLYEKGLAIDKRLSRLLKDDPITFYNLACSYALTGRPEEAVAALQRCVRLGYSDFDHLRNDPDLKSLQQHPQFLELLGKKNRP